MSVTTPTPNTSSDSGILRIQIGYRVIVAGFILIGLTVIATLVIWFHHTKDDQIKLSDLSAYVATVTGLVGTVVGAFFGVNAAGAARDQANAARQDAENISRRALASLDPATGKAILDAAPGEGPRPGSDRSGQQ